VSRKSKTPHEDALDIREGSERAKLTGADKFYARIHPEDAAKAREWVTRNLSRKAQIVMNQAANSTKTEVEASMQANAVISAAHDAVVAEMPTHEAMAAAALGKETEETAAFRKQVARQAEAAAREVKLAAATTPPANMVGGKPANLSRLNYRKGRPAPTQLCGL